MPEEKGCLSRNNQGFRDFVRDPRMRTRTINFLFYSFNPNILSHICLYYIVFDRQMRASKLFESALIKFWWCHTHSLISYVFGIQCKRCIHFPTAMAVVMVMAATDESPAKAVRQRASRGPSKSWDEFNNEFTVNFSWLHKLMDDKINFQVLSLISSRILDQSYFVTEQTDK